MERIATKLAGRSRDVPLADLNDHDSLVVLNGSPHGALMVGEADGRIIWANKAAHRAYRGQNPDLTSMEVDEVLLSYRELRRSAQASVIREPFVVQFRLHDGSALPVEVFEQRYRLDNYGEVSLLHLRDAAGQFGVLKQEERLRHLLADSFGATMIIMPNGIVRYVAPSIQHILGYTEQELIGTNIRSLEHAEERRQVGAFVRAMPKDGTSKRMELRIRHADGHYRHIECTIRNLTKNPDVGGILANFRDITERIEAERDARRRAEEVHVLARYRTMSELGSAIAHELNQPVAAIRNYAAGCLRTLDGPGGLEQSRWALQQIEGEAERATRIMRSVYNFTKHKRVERKVLPVVDIIADIFAFLQLKVQETEATLVLDVKKGLTAWCDKTLIGQAILNLVARRLRCPVGVNFDGR